MGKFVGERVIDYLGENLGELPAEAGERTFSQFSRFMEAKGKDSLGQIREAMQAIMTEIREGRGILNPDHNTQHVWIDLRHLPDYVHDVQIPEVTGFFKKFVAIDPKRELCPVQP